jgi:hypothetical protein
VRQDAAQVVLVVQPAVEAPVDSLGQHHVLDAEGGDVVPEGLEARALVEELVEVGGAGKGGLGLHRAA